LNFAPRLEVSPTVSNTVQQQERYGIAQVYDMFHLFYELLILIPIQPNGGGVVATPIPLGLDVSGPHMLEEEEDLELIDAEVDKRWRDERRKRESTET